MVLVAGVMFMDRYHLNEVEILPAHATNVAPIISVSGVSTDAHRDQIMLTDVYVQQITVLRRVLDYFNPHVAIVPIQDLTAPNVPISELDAQAYVDMSQSKQFAVHAALTALGWNVPVRRLGAEVGAIASWSRAYRPGGLHIGDIITNVNGNAVSSTCQLNAVEQRVSAGTPIQVRYLPATISDAGVITYGRSKTVTLPTYSSAVKGHNNGCGASHGDTVIGIESTDAFKYATPGTISISTPDIGGPSAGLAMTLGVIDRLSAGSLTGGHKIAVTGTMNESGDVGDVGGVAQKTIAAENAGASVFIVPDSEVTVARNASNGSLRVIGVNTLSQALRELRHLGGAVPTPLTAPYPLKFAS